MTAAIDLLDTIGNDAADEPGYCGDHYWEWEQNTAKPRLEALGYRFIRAYNGDADSFGPLSRMVLATKDGVRHTFMYG